MKSKLIKEDKKYYYVKLYFDTTGNWDWNCIKLKIPKNKLKEV